MSSSSKKRHGVTGVSSSGEDLRTVATLIGVILSPDTRTLGIITIGLAIIIILINTALTITTRTDVTITTVTPHLQYHHRNITTTARNITAAHCLRDFSESQFGAQQVVYMNLAFSLSQFLLFLALPVCTMGFCYARIACIVYASAKEPNLRDAR